MRPLDEREMSPRTVTLGLQVRLMSVSIRRDHVPSRNQQTKHTEQQFAQHRVFDPDDEKRTSDDCFRNQWVIFPRREFTHQPKYLVCLQGSIPGQVLSADFGLTVLVARLHHKCRRGGSTATPVGFKIF